MHETTTQAVAITRHDGSVAIMHVIVEAQARCFSPSTAEENGFTLSDDRTRWRRDVTDEMIEADIAKSSRGAASWRRIADAEIPPHEHRAFRDAWIDNGKSVAVDMTKARAIHRDRLRADRAPLFSNLDGDYARADETGDANAKRAVVIRKQALRDAPAHARIEAASTPEELADLTLAALTGESGQ